jgi:hypothetical protein
MKTYLISIVFLFSCSLFAQPTSALGTISPTDGEDNDLFGEAIAIQGDFAIMTSKGDRTTGSAYVFSFQNGSWVESQKLVPDSSDSGNGFGNAVAMSNEYALIGFWADDDLGTNSGSAMVYRNNNGSWEFEQKLLPDSSASSKRFGTSVAISGDYAIVGTPTEQVNQKYGAAYIFHREASGWQLVQRLTADISTFGDDFGASVALTDGYAFVGAPNVDASGINSGVVYVFAQNDTSWSEFEVLSPADARLGYNFGQAMAFSDQSLAVAAPDAGATYNTAFGHVYLFELQGSSWEETQKLVASDAEDGDKFGYSLSLACDHLLVGARYNEEGGFNAGAAYFFTKQGNTWSEEAKVTGSVGELMGMGTAISCDKALVGASHSGINGSNSGRVYAYLDSSTVGLAEGFPQGVFSFYPNPATSHAYLSIEPFQPTTLRLYNVQGSLVKQVELTEARSRIDLAELAPGVYFGLVHSHRFTLVKQ